MTADNNASPFGLSWNTPLKINDISLSKSACENCDVYYYETGSTELTQFEGTITHSNQPVPYGIVFFVAPHEGYALTEIIANNTKNAEFFSIANNDDISETDFYTKNSGNSNMTPVQKLLAAGFDETGLSNLVTEAKDQKNCVAAFIYSRSGTNNANISDTLSFYAKKLATLEKKVDHVTRGNEQLNLATQKVRAGDIITYSFTVTYYQGTDSITYENIRVTDSRVTDPQTMEFQGPAGGNTTEIKTATYTVTEQDIINAAQNEDKLTNTATLTYTYQAPYNNGAYTVSDTATANVTTVGTVSYEYKGTVPDGVANLPTTASHEKNEQVRVADRPNNITGYTFEGWTAPDGVTVNSDGYFAMPDKSITFTGKWIAEEAPGTPTKPTKAVDAKYFVLLPGRGTPASGEDQGTSYYLPNETSDGGVSGKDVDTGYPGGLTAEGKNAANQNYNYSDAKNGVFNSAGVPNNYLVIPDDLGFFTASNWKNGQYTKNTNTTNLSTVLGETFNVNNVRIIWYAIKWQGDGYHVDGYVAGIPVTLTYHDNFTGSNDSYTQNELKSGETASIAQNGAVSGSKTFSHAGYVFKGWYDNADCTGTNYAGQTHTMMDNLNLYAKWEKNDYNYTVKFYRDAVSEANYILDADQTKKAAFGTALNDLSVDTTIAGDKCPDGYNTQGTINAANSLTEIGLTNNVVSVVLSKRTDLSYTVNYLEKGTNNPVKTATTVNNQTFGTTITAAEKAIAINGYTYDSADPATLTIGTSSNVINLYYTKATEYKITICYINDAGTSIKEAKTILNKHEGDPYNVESEDYIPTRIGDYIKESVPSNVKGAMGKSDVNITVVYTKDVLVDSTVVPKPDGPGDNIPDKYQVTINYVDDNTGRGRITGQTKEVLTIKDTEGKWASTGTVTANGSTATDNGGRNYFSNWTNNAGLATSSTAKLGKQTFTAEGGETYTFTANFGYSGGGGSGGSNRPKPPVVDIPDDVPTGLNGKDHYAYIIGYGNNDVRPQNNITRAEVATIFFRLLTDETREANMTKSNSYNDVKDGDWFCCAVSTLSKMGIIKGYEDGSFKPNDPISRAEFAAIAARFDPDGDKTPATFADVTSHWAKDEISIAANHGWIKGYEDGSFKPDQKITRAETMTLVNRVLNRLPETKDDLHKDMKTWVDNMDETAWYYLAVQEATNSHYFKNKTSTKFEQWTDLRDTRDWSELEK